VSSDAVPAPQSEPEATPEQYRQRALLLADLGRYDEAAGELAAGLAVAPTDPDLLTTLARVHLGADQPAEAMTAADRAVAAAPDAIGPLVVRAMALADTRRFAEGAEVARTILRRWPADAYAQRTGAALLSETRNGQDALNAAWDAVRIAPSDAEAHLVLAVVSARLRLFDLAQRAYAETLDLDPALAEAQLDVGVVHLERRRWAKALEAVADAAALAVPEDAVASRRADADRDTRSADAVPNHTDVPDISRPTGPVLDPSGHTADVLRRTVLYGSNAVLVAGLLTALMATASAGASRVWAGMIGVVILVAIAVWSARQLTEPSATALRRLRERDRRLAAAIVAVFAAPVLIIAYALVGGLVPLITAMVVAAVAEAVVLTRR
jgi:tetratricopeptide (TPR) repeat protein